MDQKAYAESVYTVPQVAKMFGINRNLAYDLARRGTLPAIRLGKRLVCPKVAIDRMLREPGESLNSVPMGGRDVERD